MGRKANDGRGRLGGRKPGTPNKATKTVRQWLNDLINKNRAQVEKDLKALQPKDRLAILEKLMQYTVPKMNQSNVNIDRLSEEDLDAVIAELIDNMD